MATIKSKSERDYRLVNSTNQQSNSLQFNKIKVGKTTLANDVTLDLDGILKAATPSKRPIKKEDVEKALRQNNIKELRRISNIFYNTSGIYSRLCRYMAYLFKYDWFITPMVYDDTFRKEEKKKKKVVEGWYKSSLYLENCKLKRNFGEIALKVIKDGCYYGYRLDQKMASYLQELPANYCRSRYELNGRPAVEFNLKYFDDAFSDVEYKIRVLKMWPKEFYKGWALWKQGKLPKDSTNDEEGWILLDPSKTVKFNLSNSDAPLFVPIIPKLLDLEEAQNLDKKKMLQQILKIIIQKMPIDKNGDLIFDVDEAQTLHNNAVMMLGDAIGVDVLTTFADVDVADLSDKGNVSSVDQLDKVERAVYNEAGVSQSQFNSNSNLALEKSIANDEATMINLVRQFEEFAESLLEPFNKSAKKVYYKLEILPTTIYNYKDIAKNYKELTSLGFSKLLPQVALGQSQSVVIMTAYFENDMMSLNDVFVPPQLSSTMSGKDADKKDAGQPKKLPSQDEGGRPELPDDEKSDKTIQNRESEG